MLEVSFWFSSPFQWILSTISSDQMTFFEHWVQAILAQISLMAYLVFKGRPNLLFLLQQGSSDSV